jgi:hypothetical protein
VGSRLLGVGWTLTISRLPSGGFGKVCIRSPSRLDLDHPPTPVGGILELTAMSSRTDSPVGGIPVASINLAMILAYVSIIHAVYERMKFNVAISHTYHL